MEVTNPFFFRMVQHILCFLFRSLTSSSGATNTWRKGLRRRLKRFVFCQLCLFRNTQYHNSKASKFMSILFQIRFCIISAYGTDSVQFSLHDWVSVFALWQLLLFLKGFTESERNKLAMLTGILLANGNLSASILSSLFNENLVKEGAFLCASWACLVVFFFCCFSDPQVEAVGLTRNN